MCYASEDGDDPEPDDPEVPDLNSNVPIDPFQDPDIEDIDADRPADV